MLFTSSLCGSSSVIYGARLVIQRSKGFGCDHKLLSNCTGIKSCHFGRKPFDIAERLRWSKALSLRILSTVPRKSRYPPIKGRNMFPSFSVSTLNQASKKPFPFSFYHFRLIHTSKGMKAWDIHSKFNGNNIKKSFPFNEFSKRCQIRNNKKQNLFTSDTTLGANTAALGRSSLRQNALFEKGFHFLKRIGVGVGLAFLGGTAWVYYVTVTDKYKLEKKIRDKEPEVDIQKPESEFHHPYAEKPWWWKFFFTVKRYIFLFFTFAPILATSIYASTYHPKDEHWTAYIISELLKAMEKAGCCFLKLGQWVSMRPDMFPKTIIDAMAQLRQSAPSHDFLHTKNEIESSFRKPLHEIFESFDEIAIASGTIAQIHRATLKEEYALPDGTREVAVKVRHPNILNETFVDLDFIFSIVDTFLPSKYSLPCSKEELTHIMSQQLDLRWEAYNLLRFAHNFKRDVQSGLINFPQVSPSLGSESVLIESWIEGQTVANMFSDVRMDNENTWASLRRQYQESNPDNLISDKIKEKKKQLARILFDLNVKMFLRDNYVHGDMHAGNILYSIDDGQLTLIDAGLITSLKADVSDSFGDFLRALCASDVDTLVDKLLEFNVGKTEVDKPAFYKKISDITERQVKNKAQDNYTLGDVVGDILLNLQHHGIVLRGDVAASICTISISEGLILQLDPDFDMVMHALPYFVRYKGWESAEAAWNGGKRNAEASSSSER